MRTLQEDIESYVVRSLVDENIDLTKVASWKDNYRSSPEATYMAACHCIIKNDEENLGDIMKVACDYHVEDRIMSFAKEFKKEATKEKYALMMNGKGYIPLDNPKEAELYFENNYHKFPTDVRIKVASKIASALDTVTGKMTRLYSGKDIKLNTKKASLNIAEKSMSVDDVDAKKMYVSLAKMMAINKDNNNLIKISSMVEKLDKYLNKSAEDEEYEEDDEEDDEEDYENEVINVADKKYTVYELSEIPKETYIKAFGNNLADKLFKDNKADMKSIKLIMPTIPRADMAIFNKYVGG